ncbi:hypothetical protein HK096_009538, partial [Nowakowskiella sp. JEL0078]
MSIDNLPTEMPLEASEYFSSALFPFIKELIKENYDHPVLKRATITEPGGKLAKNYLELVKSIEKYGELNSAQVISHSKRVLLLGSGFVAPPFVEYISRNPGYHLTVASFNEEEMKKLSSGRKNVTYEDFNVTNKSKLNLLVSHHDVIVSFIPSIYHVLVAEACIENKKHLVTASYISSAMKDLDSRAKNAGITLLNEIGLDPGIDHLTAMQVFDEIRAKRGALTSFISWCGGLPAPEASNNPLGYKFSWSPKGQTEIATISLLKSIIPDVPIFRGFAFEGIPNRNSLEYLNMYGFNNGNIPETFFRGTLRYK